jgi:hypothetical protein
MFKKIATRTVLAAVAVASIASMTTTDAKAWVIYRTWGYHYYTPRVYYYAPVRTCSPAHYTYNGYFVPAQCW